MDSRNEYRVLVRKDIPFSPPQNFKFVQHDYYPLSLRTLHLLKDKYTFLQPDIYHSPYYLAPLNSSCPVVVTAHDVALLSPEHYCGRSLPIRIYAKWFVKYSLRKSFRNARIIVAVSNNVREDIIKMKLADGSKVRVVYPSINLPQSSSDGKEGLFSQKNHKPVILTVGQTRLLKNWWRLIRAFRILRDKLGQGTLILVSSDDRNLKSIQALIAELKFKPEEISILGYQSQEELVRLYKSADLFVFPSLYEGFGLPPLEAMSCGVPVIASDRGSLPEVLGDAAYFVNPESVEDIAAGMQKILEDSQLRDNLIQKGYQQVKKYSWEKTARQILDIYDEVYQETKR